MSQRDLVAALRTFRAADVRAKEARAALDAEIRKAVTSGEWPIVDVAELTGWSRETIRKIVNPPSETEKRSLNEPRGIRNPPRRPRADI